MCRHVSLGKNQSEEAAGKTNRCTPTKLGWRDCPYGRMRAFGVAVADGCKGHVPYAGNFICVGTSELVKFSASSTKLSKLVLLDEPVTVMQNCLPCVHVIRTCNAREIFAPHSIHIGIGRGCSSYQWTHGKPNMAGGCHQAWVCSFRVAGAEWCSAHVPEWGNSLYLGSYEFVSFELAIRNSAS